MTFKNVNNHWQLPKNFQRIPIKIPKNLRISKKPKDFEFTASHLVAENLFFFFYFIFLIYWNLIFAGMMALLLPLPFGNGLLNLSLNCYWLDYLQDLDLIDNLIIFHLCLLYGLEHLWYPRFTSWHVQIFAEILRHMDYWKLFGWPLPKKAMKTKCPGPPKPSRASRASQTSRTS